MGHPVKFNARKICVRKFLQQIDTLRTLDRNLREIIGKIFDCTVKLASVIAHPRKVFFARAGIDHQKVFVFAKPVNNHVVHKRSLRIKQRGILCLPNRKPRGIVHRDMLHRCNCLTASQPDVAHMTDIEDAHASPHCIVLRDNSAANRGRVLHRHVPAIELDHLRAQPAMSSVQGSFSDAWRGFDRGQ